MKRNILLLLIFEVFYNVRIGMVKLYIYNVICIILYDKLLFICIGNNVLFINYIIEYFIIKSK